MNSSRPPTGPPPPLMRPTSRPPSRPPSAPVFKTRPDVVSDIMSRKVITVCPDDTLDKIDDVMHQFRFAHLPVVDREDHRLVGILTHGDLLRVSASVFSSDAARRNKFIFQNAYVGNLMKRDVVTARPSDSLTRAAMQMWNHRIGCLPVTDDGGILVGIVTEADFLKLAIVLLQLDAEENG